MSDAQYLVVTDDVRRNREKWRYTGRLRPEFAVTPSAGQRSVWDFPRPPRIEPVAQQIRVEAEGNEIASTRRGRQVLETSGAPTYYFPPEDVRVARIRLSGRRFHCEWKGISDAFDVGEVVDAGWQLTEVYSEFAEMLGWYAFYPQRVACFVGAERAGAQPGGYYGGWVTRDLAGPIKGGPGTSDW